MTFYNSALKDLEKSFEVNKLKLKISYIQLEAITTYPLVCIRSYQVLATLVGAFEEVRKHFIIKAENKSEQRRSLSVCLRYASYLWEPVHRIHSSRYSTSQLYFGYLAQYIKILGG